MEENYTSPYAKNVPSMYNSEVVALAKNRWTDNETQLAIAKHWYRLGREYLAANPNITQEAAQELWTVRGYVLKASLLAKGRIKLKKGEYTEVYRKYFKNNHRSSWRMYQAFLGGYWYGSTDTEKNATPSELLQEIYDDLPDDEKRGYILEKFIAHQNCSLELAIRLSTIKTPENPNHYYQDDFDRIRQTALMKVAEITQKQLEGK
jgi:hypothetical protein